MRLFGQGPSQLILSMGVILSLSSPLLFGSEENKAHVRDAQLLPHMQIAYQALIKILSATAKDQDSGSPKDFAKTEASLKVLSEEAKAIHALVQKNDKGHEFLSQELQKSSELAYIRYKNGFRDQSKFHLSEVVNTCFSCHTSRNSVVDSSFTSAFSKDLEQDEFDPLARARFLSLSRQFESSAAAYESLLLGRNIGIDELMNFDPMVEYLILSLRVKNDSGRALKTFQKMQKQPYPEVVKRDLNTWIEGLQSIPSFDPKASSLDNAKALIAQAKASMEFPRDRSGMVQYVLASKYLHDYLINENLSKDQKAQAYYELGGCELILATQFSSDEANTYFAEVIRLSPKSDLARKAYARYEENVLYSFSGSSGLHLPDDEKAKMIDLKKLSF